MAKVTAGGDPDRYMDPPMVTANDSNDGSGSFIAKIFDALGIHKQAANDPKQTSQSASSPQASGGGGSQGGGSASGGGSSQGGGGGEGGGGGGDGGGGGNPLAMMEGMLKVVAGVVDNLSGEQDKRAIQDNLENGTTSTGNQKNVTLNQSEKAAEVTPEDAKTAQKSDVLQQVLDATSVANQPGLQLPKNEGIQPIDPDLFAILPRKML